jgi:hypothetical protein
MQLFVNLLALFLYPLTACYSERCVGSTAAVSCMVKSALKHAIVLFYCVSAELCTYWRFGVDSSASSVDERDVVRLCRLT